MRDRDDQARGLAHDEERMESRPAPRKGFRFQSCNFNPRELDESRLDAAKYFIVKTWNIEDVIVSIEHGLWCSTDQGNRKLNHGYRENKGSGAPVYLIFNMPPQKDEGRDRGRFCGVAEMTGFVDFKAKTTVWTSSKSRWKGRMKLQWRYVKDIPYKMVNHIKLDNNAGKPISFTQDCHDVPAEQGKEFLRIVHNHNHESSVLDDMDRVEDILYRSDNRIKKEDLLPKPVNRSNLRVSTKLIWHQFVYDHYGQVTKIMDGNYGILTGFAMYWGDNKQRVFEPFQVLFDTFDVFLGDKDCNELGKELTDVLAVGDLVRFHAVRLESAKAGEHRDIRHLCTGMVAAKTPDKLKSIKFPLVLDQVVSLDQVITFSKKLIDG